MKSALPLFMGSRDIHTFLFVGDNIHAYFFVRRGTQPRGVYFGGSISGDLFRGIHFGNLCDGLARLLERHPLQRLVLRGERLPRAARVACPISTG
jgi:hypothetical protein